MSMDTAELAAADPAKHFSTYQPSLQGDPEAPVEMLKRLRDAGPMLHSEEFGGFWIPTRYEDIRAIARDTTAFSTRQAIIPWRNARGGARAIPQELDGEKHRLWRQVLADAFSPGTVSTFTPTFRAAAVELIEAVADQGSCDFVEAVAVKLPAEAFLANFGMPREKLQPMLDFKNWFVREALPKAESDEEIFAAKKVIWGYFAEELEHRRANDIDGPDVISRLLRARIEGKPIPDEDIINACDLAMVASLDTTTSALGLAWARLATRPDLQEAAADPAKRVRLREELLRREPVGTNARLVVEETTVAGVTLKPGEKVLMSWGLAAFDPDVYDDPDEIKLDRKVTSSLAFGVGPHRCLGMHLARSIIDVALEEWHVRIPRYRLTEGAAPRGHFTTVRGLDSLPLSY